jgi:glycosyltransferase involved in cell wall biosynthesis
LLKIGTMRILLINSEYPPIGGGASNASANVAAIWAAEGHQVMVLTACYAGLPSEETIENVRVVRIPSRRTRVDRSTPFEQISFMLSALVHTVRRCASWRPDVTVAYFGVPSGPAALLAKWLYRVPYVVSLRGGDVPGFRSYDFGLYHKLISPVLHLIWRGADAVVANSEGLRKLAQAFDGQVPIQVIPNGVNVETYTDGPRSWDPPVLLTVGRLVSQKGIDVLFHGLAAVKDLPWNLYVVGDGKDKAKLEELSEKLGLARRIDLVGWKRRDELIEYYRLANLYVHTSFDEGMSNAVLEAMASGLPLLATGISGNLDVVVNGQTGMLIPPGDPNAISAALRVMLPEADLRQRYGTAGRERVAKDYTWGKTASEYLDLLDAIRKRKPTGS